MSENPLPNAEQQLQVLRASPVFGALPESALQFLQQQLRVQTVAAGEMVLHEGSAADSLIVVFAGRLRVTRHGPQGE
ncbi:MAG: cyclic nucleotide-binding domain-containing protein, partial [Inhella sp.]|nr:cyclic nucleotide-binding domain-containing protein [Inhella sp.]